MPQLYYDNQGKVTCPQDCHYSTDSIDHRYNMYVDTLYYYGYCKNKGLPTETDIKRKIMHCKNMLLLKLTELEVSVGYSAADCLVEMFDDNQVSGWMKEFERKVTPEGEVFLYPKQ